MPLPELLGLLVLGALAWFWVDSARAREAGIDAARSACEADQLQLLDDTVALGSLKFSRDDDGRVALRRVYNFEFSDTGDNRRRGSIVLLGHDVVVVNAGLRLVHGGGTTLH
jgi:hypothetical protein